MRSLLFFLIAAFLLPMGCTGSQDRCRIESGIVTDMYDFTETVRAENRDEITPIVDLMSDMLIVGQVAVDACVAVKNRDGFMSWLNIGLRVFDALVRVLDRVGIDIPEVIGDIIDGIRQLFIEDENDGLEGYFREKVDMEVWHSRAIGPYGYCRPIYGHRGRKHRCYYATSSSAARRVAV